MKLHKKKLKKSELQSVFERLNHDAVLKNERLTRKQQIKEITEER